MAFFQQGYEVPSTSNYMKFEEGENVFRILGSFEDGTAILGTEYWKTVDGKRKPIRVRMGVSVPMSELEVNPETGELEMPKHFWALPVYNYKEKKMQILEITQKTIQLAIKGLAYNKKWGDPSGYDLVVTRIKEGGKTSYTVTPDPKEPISEEVKKAQREFVINIAALFDGKDPFAQVETDNEGLESLMEDK